MSAPESIILLRLGGDITVLEGEWMRSDHIESETETKGAKIFDGLSPGVQTTGKTGIGRILGW